MVRFILSEAKISVTTETMKFLEKLHIALVMILGHFILWLYLLIYSHSSVVIKNVRKGNITILREHTLNAPPHVNDYL